MSMIPMGMMDETASGGSGDRLLLWPRVKDSTGLSRTTAWRLEREGEFPARVQLSPGRVGWWESEVTAWKKSRRLARILPVAGGAGRPRRRKTSATPLPSDDPPPTSSAAVLAEQGQKPGRAAEAQPVDPGGRHLPSPRSRSRRQARVSPDQLGFDF